MKRDGNMVRHATLLFLLLAGALSLALFALKYEVQDLEDELTGLNHSIMADTQAIHVLEAEWSHLNDPARLRVLSERHLRLDTVDPAQLGTFDDLPDMRPAAGDDDDFAATIRNALTKEREGQ